MVAPVREAGANGRGCLVCALSPDQRMAVNGAIWEGTERAPAYRKAGLRAYRAQTGEACDPKTITRHVEHVERTWREPTEGQPTRPGEEPVFATDYKSIHDRAALLSAQAMEALGEMVREGTIEARELVNLAKMGVTARSNQERMTAASKRPMIELRAIFAVGSGHADQFPEHEVIEVVPVDVLKAEVAEERRLLEARQRGEAVAAASAFEELFDPA